MARRRNQYRVFDRSMSRMMLLNGGLFVLFLVFAGFGIEWAKILVAIAAIALSVFGLVILVLKQELLRQRSLWMTVCCIAVIVCIIVSLATNFPSPAEPLPGEFPSSQQG